MSSDTKPPASPGSPPDLWARFRASTPARIGLFRAGDAITTSALLEFQLAHAKARAAIHHGVDFAALAARLGQPTRHIRSAAPDRATYIRRPDFGRKLNEASRAVLAAGHTATPSDVALIVADGLSSAAVEDHAVPLLHTVLPSLGAWRLAPIVLAEQARVALSDEIGAALNARLAVMLIGERPGLTVRNSLGIYLTYDPKPGRTDGERNCISNIHEHGLSYREAADKLLWLMREALRRKATGFSLKEAAALTHTLRKQPTT